MDNVKIREPIQKRSIEKKEKIIKAGFNLICKKGYYNTNTVEIAKEAGVSTGIVYNYFNDKKDILIEGINEYANSIMFPILESLKDKKLDSNYINNNIETIVDNLINVFIKNHKLTKSAHKELMALSYLDKDVGNYINNKELMLTEEIVKLLDRSGYKLENPKEKVHLIINLIETLCKEIVYHNHNSLDKEIMKKETVKLILDCLNN